MRLERNSPSDCEYEIMLQMNNNERESRTKSIRLGKCNLHKQTTFVVHMYIICAAFIHANTATYFKHLSMFTTISLPVNPILDTRCLLLTMQLLLPSVKDHDVLWKGFSDRFVSYSIFCKFPI